MICGSVAEIGAAIFAFLAAYIAYRTWGLEKLPVVHAVGTFIISTKPETNNLRDEYIRKESSLHTLQLVNVGRGPAKKVIPSVCRSAEGKLLEASNSHSFPLPANGSTRELGEALLVHGQRFVSGNEYELEFSQDRKTGYFYVYFENHESKPYVTRVAISRVEGADGELGELIRKDGIEVWKVMDNKTEKL